MRRRQLFVIAAGLLPGAAFAQSQPTPTPPWRGSGPPGSAAEREERHRWLEENWNNLPAERRLEAQQRFHRGMGAQRPGDEEMRQRWQGMTPGQRQELMYGPHRMGRGGRHRMGGPMGPPGGPPPDPPRQGG
ncbi:hypothetical protein [Falsiroseomonas sp. E2-1-a20]|uniref:hypothetical protein n=1 Tax=Falsiroseomonas sp. E2-1-a20 TaxID=3239300 RepID=UPI003F37BA9B